MPTYDDLICLLMNYVRFGRFVQLLYLPLWSTIDAGFMVYIIPRDDIIPASRVGPSNGKY